MITLLDKVELLVGHHLFDSQSSLQAAAYRSLLILRPELKAELAVLLYTQEEVSLGRAAEMAGLSREEFKHLLSGRGIDRHLYATDTADVDADVVLLLSQS
jgi:predicted HTH domain antitoxin